MREYKIDKLTFDALQLLEELIAIPSLSRQENNTADATELFLKERNMPAQRMMNNVYCINKNYNSARPTILLNSHHDTVPPAAGYTNDPNKVFHHNGKIFGLGATDAGASLVSLLAAFIYFFEEAELLYNIVFAATAEEEISGHNGIALLFQQVEFYSLFGHADSFAIVGEPTQLALAIAEKGLLVLDCIAHGKAGHAAREEGDNAIYHAMKAIDWFKNYRFQKSSSLLGDVKMTVTSMSTENKVHNVVPAACSFVVDIRVNELYTHEEIIGIIREHVSVSITARSMRLRSSFIPQEHLIVQAGMALGKKVYGSPTMSDMALIPLPTIKCGPGNSAQSHTANEFVQISDVEEAVEFYVSLLERLVLEQM